jgi:hypothetical protein
MNFSGWRALLMVFMLMGALIASGHSLAQGATPTPTPVPAMLLPLNETVRGQLRGVGDNVTYRFDVPFDQDIVIALDANKFILMGYCVHVTGPSSNDDGCQKNGGGGGDGPVAYWFDIPATNRPDTRQTIELTLTRPLDGTARYQLKAYPLTPQPLTLGQSIEVRSAASQGYHVYTLDADPTQPFTIQIEDAAVDGDFLWVAHQPYLADPATLAEDRQLFPQRLDGAERASNPKGIQWLELYYLGGNVFRVVVYSGGSYSLYATPLLVQSLPENSTLMVTISYRTPLQVVRLDTRRGDVANIRFRVIAGTGALVGIYTQGNLVGNSLALGTKSVTGSLFPLDGTIQRAVDTDSDLYVVVQVPYEFTRSQVRVQMEWQRLAA